jgi:type I restriction enzyme S subunit
VVSSAHFSNFKIRWDDCPHVSRERYELDDNIQLSLGDILLMKDGAALGKLALVDELPGDACLNSHLLLFRPLQRGLNLSYWPKFAFYYLQTTLFQEYMQTRGTGATFMGVSQDTIFRHQVLWPSSGEQLLIAAFLDHETAKIDALVEEQQRLIELLNEKRQAVISQAVTKGLDSERADEGLRGGVAGEGAGALGCPQGQLPQYKNHQWLCRTHPRYPCRRRCSLPSIATHQRQPHQI